MQAAKEGSQEFFNHHNHWQYYDVEKYGFKQNLEKNVTSWTATVSFSTIVRASSQKKNSLIIKVMPSSDTGISKIPQIYPPFCFTPDDK